MPCLLLCLLPAAALVMLVVVLALVCHRVDPVAAPADLFGFAKFAGAPPKAPPPVQRYPARDGEPLAFRFYDSAAARILILVHGSSYHGAPYHDLAAAVGAGGAAKVVLPNLRGHLLSGARRGDVAYVGQLEDDIADLIAHLRANGHAGPVFLGGHSSGGGFVIRFAGGPHAGLVSGYVMLAPVIPLPPFMRHGSAGGWCNVNLPRILGLMLLNALGVRALNGLEAISFNKPVALRDGTETLSYSYNLNASYHPRHRYRADLAAIRGPSLVLIGDRDQAIAAEPLRDVFAKMSPGTDFRVLGGVDHFGVFMEAGAIAAVVGWLKAAG